jgi:RHS repeat-associated protein
MAAAGHQRQQGGREPVLRSTPERKRSGHPYGAERWSSGTLPTDYRFTGQRFDSYTQLTIMGSRWYDSELGRWISPDTIVPDPANPQSLNRYSYTLNNPLRYTDPSGHKSRHQWAEEYKAAHNGQEPTDQDWWDYQFSLQFEGWVSAMWDTTYLMRSLFWNADITLKAGDVKWTLETANRVEEAVKRIGESFGGDVRRFVGDVTVVLQSVVQPIWEKILRPNQDWAGYEYWGHVYIEPTSGVGTIIHEMGHFYDMKEHLSGKYKQFLKSTGIKLSNRSEAFAQDFRLFVLGERMDPARKDYFNQFALDICPNANGYIWPAWR